MTYREFLARIERGIESFKQAQENEGVEPGDEVEEDDLLGELIGHLEDETQRPADEFG